MFVSIDPDDWAEFETQPSTDVRTDSQLRGAHLEDCLLRYETQKYASRMGEGIVQDDVACALPVAPSINHANSGPFVRHRRILFHAATG